MNTTCCAHCVTSSRGPSDELIVRCADVSCFCHKVHACCWNPENHIIGVQCHSKKEEKTYTLKEAMGIAHKKFWPEKETGTKHPKECKSCEGEGFYPKDTPTDSWENRFEEAWDRSFVGDLTGYGDIKNFIRGEIARADVLAYQKAWEETEKVIKERESIARKQTITQILSLVEMNRMKKHSCPMDGFCKECQKIDAQNRLLESLLNAIRDLK